MIATKNKKAIGYQFFLFVLFGLLSSSAFSQSLEELEKKYAEASNAEKIQLAIEIANRGLSINEFYKSREYVDKAKIICEQEECIAEHENMLEVLDAEMLLMSGSDSLFQAAVFPNVDSSAAKYSPIVLARALELTGIYFLINGKNAEAFSYLDRAENILREGNLDDKRLAKVLEYKGFVLNFQSRYEEALDYSKQVDSIYAILKDTFNLVNSMITTSIFQSNLSGSQASLETLLAAKNLCDQYPPAQELQRGILEGIADAYMAQKQFVRADTILLGLIDEFEKLTEEELALAASPYWSAYSTLCRSAIKQGNADKAMEYAEHALEIFNQSPGLTKLHGISTQIHLAEAHNLASNYEQANEILKKIVPDFGVDENLDAFNARMANILSEISLSSNLTPSYEMLTKFNVIADRLIQKNDGTNNRELLSAHRLNTIYAILSQDVPLAMTSLKASFSVVDSIHEKALESATNELLVQYEANEKEQKIKIQELELARKSSQRNGLFLIAIILAVLAMISYLYYRQSKNLAKTLNVKVQERTKELQTANKELQLSNEELERFTYIASHDLKEPMRNILSFVSVLDGQPNIEEKQKEYLQHIQRNANQMYRLIEDVLELSSLRGRESVLKEVKLESLLMDVQYALKDKIKMAGARIHTNALPSIKADYAGLLVIFKNLLDNALKYKSEAPLQIEVSHQEDEQFHYFHVKDNGIGIAAEYHDRIFDMFKRLHHRDSIQGSGLGLAICKKIANSLGGGIRVESEEGKGATFVFHIKK